MSLARVIVCSNFVMDLLNDERLTADRAVVDPPACLLTFSSSFGNASLGQGVDATCAQMALYAKAVEMMAAQQSSVGLVHAGISRD